MNGYVSDGHPALFQQVRRLPFPNWERTGKFAGFVRKKHNPCCDKARIWLI
jgi:hypothetical protein